MENTNLLTVPSGTLPILSTEPVTFAFADRGETLLEIGPRGFRFRGVLIEDAGEAHRAFIEAMNRVGR